MTKMIIFVGLIAGVITLTIFLILRKFRYWERKNVATGNVTLFFGDTYELCMGQISSTDMLVKLYNKVPEYYRYVGAYLFHVPVLVLRTPDVIKQICIKDFEYFVDHGNIILNSSDDMWQKSLFPLKGKEWRGARQIYSPILYKNKVKMVFPLMQRRVEGVVNYMKEKKEDIVEVEFKDMILRILNDVTTDVGMGIEVDSFREPKNMVFEQGEASCNLNSPYNKIVLLLYTLCPSIPTFLRMSLFGAGKEYFSNIIKDTIKNREQKGTRRNDVIDILLEVREKLKGKADKDEETMRTIEMSYDDMAAYIFVMYFGIIDSIPPPIAFLAWELAFNNEIQEKLRKECDSVTEDDEEATFQDIMEMKYMDMVIKETLRKYPGAVATDRIVTKPYTIKPELPHEKPVHLDVGQHILLPIYAIHRNPNLYEDPEKFDPERFSAENKHKIDPYAFLTFGAGPRHCVGVVFSEVLMKLIVYQLLRSFEIVPVEKTKNPLVLDKDSLNLNPVAGFPLGLMRRT